MIVGVIGTGTKWGGELYCVLLRLKVTKCAYAAEKRVRDERRRKLLQALEKRVGKEEKITARRQKRFWEKIKTGTNENMRACGDLWD